jgi:penicillin-binding protein 1C
MKWLRRCAIIAAVLAVVALGLRLWPHATLRQQVQVSSVVYARDGSLLRLTLASDDQYRLWTPLDQVAPDYVQALLLYEDRHFYWHPGVDAPALLRAAWRSAGGNRQGASTITMQLARLMYGLNTRSIAGKLRQMAAATWLELRYAKHDILEAYVNLAPFGGNVQGVGAASLIYFHKPAAKLTFAESLTLAVIPQSPQARGRAGPESASLAGARRTLMASWSAHHAVPPEARAAAAATLTLAGPAELPFEAPHLSDALLAGRPFGVQVNTSVDLAQQHLLERVVSSYIARVRDRGITNAAALLVDARSMGVRALVGSADFHDAEIFGQVNGVAAKRSPGSALKPFIYALAMDQGLIHTRTMLKDAPTSFGVYSPENFDGHFVGPVSAHDALIASRNVPAVQLAARLAQPGLYQFLRSAGVSRMASERHYGLALALGGGEVTMEEMAALYGTLANNGIYAPVRYREAAPERQGTRLLSPEATFMVRSILADAPRPDGLTTPQQPVMWKTGTSWGFRDAWTAGLFGDWILVVWVGNFDGSSNPAFVGVQAAAPLFFRIADAVRQSSPPAMDRLLLPPPGVLQVDVCAASGDLPNADCPRRNVAWFIPGKSPIRVSDVHRRVPVDTRTGQLACAGTPRQFVRDELFEFWPSDIQRLFALAGMPRRRPPEDRCGDRPVLVQDVPPVITSPLVGGTYQLRTAHAADETLYLNATAGAGVRVLYWFADGGFVGASSPSVPLPWRPAHGGQINITVVDDQGESATRQVRVATLQ